MTGSPTITDVARRVLTGSRIMGPSSESPPASNLSGDLDVPGPTAIVWLRSA